MTDDAMWLYIVCGACAHQRTVPADADLIEEHCESCRADALFTFAEQRHADAFGEAVLYTRQHGTRP